MKRTFLSIPEILYNSRKKISISVEILPPPRGIGIKSIFDIIDSIKGIKPLWIDVTNHSPTIEWLRDPENEFSYNKNIRKKSPGTIAICGAINFKYNIPAVPHLLCHGFSREDSEDALIDLNYLGIKNILAIRGDSNFQKNKSLHANNDFALDLIKQIKNMNQGIYLDQIANKTNFCIGAACYPEKHFESPNITSSNNLLLQKQSAGIDYAVSQMFFNNDKFNTFYNSLKDDLRIPIIPGLKILSTKNQLSGIPKRFFIEIPQELVNNIKQSNTKEQVHDAGVEWTYKQCLNLIDQGHNHLHFYLMRNTTLFKKLITKLNTKFKFIK